jgi:hypothetical protein
MNQPINRIGPVLLSRRGLTYWAGAIGLGALTSGLAGGIEGNRYTQPSFAARFGKGALWGGGVGAALGPFIWKYPKFLEFLNYLG